MGTLVLRLHSSATLVLVLALGCASPSLTALHNIPDDKKLVLYVENFQNGSPSGKQYDPWCLGLAASMQDDLGVTGYFRMTSDESRRRALKELAFRETGLTADTGDVVKILGAKWILSGDFIVVDNQMTLSARLTEVETSKMVTSVKRTGAVTDFFHITKQLSVELMKQIRLEVTEGDVQYLVSKVDTADVEASLSNFEGEIAMRKIDELRLKKEAGKAPADVDIQIAKLENQARRSFRNAVEEDPQYRRARVNMHRLALLFPSGI